MTPASPSRDDRPPTDGISLLEFFDRVLEEHDKAHMAEHKGVELAAKELERRLDGLNELRTEVVQDRAMYLTLSTYEAKHQALIDRTDRLATDLEERRELLEKAVNLRIAANEKRLNDIDKALLSVYVTKDAVDALHDVGDKRLNDENTRLAALEAKSVSEEALRAYKRVVYGALFAAGLSILLAIINAFQRIR